MAEPGSSPTRIVASPGGRPCSAVNCATPSPTSARTRAATALPSITVAGIAAAEAIAGRGARARPQAQRVRCRAPASAAQLERDGPLERVPALAGGQQPELVLLAEPRGEDARGGHRRRESAAVCRAPPRQALSGVVEAEIERGADLRDSRRLDRDRQREVAGHAAGGQARQPDL